MQEGLLYQDGTISIGYSPRSPEDHVLRLAGEGKGLDYLIQRGILEELARTPRGKMAAKLDRASPDLLAAAERLGISADGVHVALCQAYQEEERQISCAVTATAHSRRSRPFILYGK